MKRLYIYEADNIGFHIDEDMPFMEDLVESFIELDQSKDDMVMRLVESGQTLQTLLKKYWETGGWGPTDYCSHFFLK